MVFVGGVTSSAEVAPTKTINKAGILALFDAGSLSLSSAKIVQRSANPNINEVEAC